MESRKRSNYKSPYIGGSAAPKIEPQTKPVPQKKVHKKKRRSAYSIHSFKNNMIVGLILFIPCIVLLFTFSLVARSNYDIQKLHREIDQVRMQNDKIKMEIAKAANSDEIRRIAKERLGMDEPQQYQIVEIDVPKSDYTVVDELPVKETKASYAWIGRLFN